MNDEWETPDELFEKLDAEFGFEIDLCANHDNAKCDTWADDIHQFAKRTRLRRAYRMWMNPPYSRGNIDACMEEAEDFHDTGHVVVCLVRFDPTATWFKEYVDGVANEVRMLKKRVKFKGADHSYNFPCCIVVYRGVSARGQTYYYSWGMDDD